MILTCIFRTHTVRGLSKSPGENHYKIWRKKLAKLVWANHPVVVGTSLAVFQAVILVIINDDDDDDNYDDDYDDDDNYDDDDVDKDGDDGLPYHKGTSLLSFQHSCKLHNSVWPVEK